MPVHSSQLTQLANTAGELEREARSRRANLFEAFAVMLILLATLWCLAYPFGVLRALPAANLASRVLIAALIIFAALISPRWHRDSLDSWGLGHPVRLLRAWEHAPGLKRFVLLGLLTVAIAALTFELYRHATGASRFVLGIEPGVTLRLQNRLGGKAAVLAVCFALAVAWATCVIRYDNFRPALQAAASILGVLLPITLLVAWAANGPGAFVTARPSHLLANGLGYVFWGTIQQLLFCSYFGTRLRKGFGPAALPGLQTWKRLGVAVLNGLFFALMHINSWLLVGFTWTLGSFLSWFFMENRYRNLQALGLVHGVLGTCVIWLFVGEPEPVHIRLRVGPWGMSHRADLVTVLVVAVVIASLSLALLAIARSFPRARPLKS